METNVVLVGFSGAGKSTLGKLTAPLLGLRFVDLDSYIEQKLQYKVPQLFSQFGELVFRKSEYDALQELLEDEGQLIAVGGGAPCYAQAMKLIVENSFSVYVKLSEEALVERLANSKKPRPLTKDLTHDDLETYVRETLKKRAPYYEQAHLIISAEDITPEDLAQAILAELPQ
ncbi:MAG: shikimate kinase [Bacteroidales bacterium]|nr:shikimate kinase [Bacteroidales bacterium]